jgi:hypothetical protein
MLRQRDDEPRVPKPDMHDSGSPKDIIYDCTHVRHYDFPLLGIGYENFRVYCLLTLSLPVY